MTLVKEHPYVFVSLLACLLFGLGVGLSTGSVIGFIATTLIMSAICLFAYVIAVNCSA
jgi:hypothetical protein